MVSEQKQVGMSRTLDGTTKESLEKTSFFKKRAVLCDQELSGLPLNMLRHRKVIFCKCFLRSLVISNYIIYVLRFTLREIVSKLINSTILIGRTVFLTSEKYRSQVADDIFHQ